MKRQLIGQRVELDYDGHIRCWYMDDQWHREDGGPVWENIKTGYCEWIDEHGNIITSDNL